jgi:N-acylneuraminate cytidylyltransferase/CMP-N,N'-diacetyllegionaminic acid synthase
VIEGLSVLAIIPARAGSKGLLGKNTRILQGKPLVQYSIEAGIQSNYIDDVIVSTDCLESIEISSKLGLKPPFKRPNNLCGDEVPSAEVIKHAINFLQEKDKKYDLFVLLEPTSPLRTSSDIDSALELMIKQGNQSLVSVCLTEDQHPNFMFELDQAGTLKPWSATSFKPTRRQDVSPAFFLEGSVYISYIKKFLENETFCHEDTAAFIMPKFKSFEIDDIVDFYCVEALMRNMSNN